MVTTNFTTESLMETIESGIKVGLEELTTFLADYARENHTYQDRTGNLTAHTVATSTRDLLNLGNSVDYAKFIEGAPFNDNWLERALTENEDYILEVLNKELSDVLR